MVKDMTVGRPTPLIISFFLPLFASSLFQQLYNTVDTMIVGQLIGKAALASVSATAIPTFLVLGLIQGLCAGFCIPVSKRFGGGDASGMRKTCAACISLGIISAVLLTTAASLLCGPLLTLMGTPDDIFKQAHIYVLIIFFGIPATIFFNISSGLIRAVGNSRTPLIILIISSLTNIALDLLFIAVIPMGVAGAALATVLAQLLSGLLCLICILRGIPQIHPRREDWGFSGKLCLELLGFGLPMGFQLALTGIGGIFNQTAINRFGTDYIAAVGATVKIQNLVMQPMESLGVAMVTYISQNLGAGKIDRIRTGIKRAAVMMVCLVCAAFAVVFFVSPLLLLLFVKPEETLVISVAVAYLRANCSFYAVLGILYLFRNVMQGLGHTLPVMFSGMMQMIMHGIVAMGLSPRFGFTVLMFENPAAWFGAAVLIVICFTVTFRRLTRQAAERLERASS